MKEQWKPVKGFEGKYIVSNFGVVGRFCAKNKEGNTR